MDGMSATDGSEIFPILPLSRSGAMGSFRVGFHPVRVAFLLAWHGGRLFRARRATDVLLRWAAPVAALSGLAWLGGIIANMAGGFDRLFDPETLILFFFQTQFGPVAAIRLFLLGGAVPRGRARAGVAGRADGISARFC